MSCTLSHKCRVMLIAELLTASTDATRGWLRAEMDRTVDPMLDSIFNRLKTKLTNVQIHQQSTSSHFNPQFVNMNYSYQQQQQNGPNHLNSNFYLKLSSQSQTITIKEEIEPMPTGQSCSYPPVSNEQSNHNLTYQNWNNDEDENSQIDLPDNEMQPQPPQLAHIKHNQFDDEECDCDECVDGGIEVKVEDEDQVDEESSRHVKRPKIDTTQPNDEIGEESIATECTINPIGPNLVQPNRHFQCSHCQKSFDNMSKLQRHLRVHTGERPFQCDLCDKRFTQKWNLDSHLLTHSGERPFACRHCEKSFADFSVRKRHEQAIHLHVKPYRCKLCGHTATVQSYIITHIRMVHFGLPKTIKQQRALNIVDERDPRELVEKV